MANGTQPHFAKREEVNGAAASRMWWRRIVNVNDTIEIRSLVSRGAGAPKHFKLAMALRRSAFSGNTSLSATFSICFLMTRFSITHRKHKQRIDDVNRCVAMLVS